MGRARERVDRYTIEMHRHGLESVEREVRWLTELIETERSISNESLQGAPPEPRSPDTPAAAAVEGAKTGGSRKPKAQPTSPTTTE
jgi:hypothetical protein